MYYVYNYTIHRLTRQSVPITLHHGDDGDGDGGDDGDDGDGDDGNGNDDDGPVMMVTVVLVMI